MSGNAIRMSEPPVMLDVRVEYLCARPYSGHAKGCPNFHKKLGCPPYSSLGEVLDLSQPTHLVYNCFDFGAHVERMRQVHPEWSQRQLECCLYWQGTARKQLKSQVLQARKTEKETSWNRQMVLYCPEALGVNVTATMLREFGIALEWPPVHRAYQVALIGTAK